MSKPHVNSRAVAKLTKLFSQNATDPNAWASISELPNPDPILRKSGRTTAIYEEIVRDPHVIGELRSLRAGLFSFNAELVPGDSDAQSLESFELAKRFFDTKPAPNTEWTDLDWHSYSAILFGFSALHLGAFVKVDGYWVPSSVETWKGSRFAFDHSHNLLVKTKENPQGELTDPNRWTCVRHIPSAENPYGLALLSSCFWSWTFKHGGFKFFVQLCERFGVPFPVGKYPVGTQDKDIDKLLDGLANLVRDGIAAIPDDTSIDIIESKMSGEPVPLQLINLCNSEMSKALTSQTLATEQQNGGARAASETHAKRAGENQRADRALVASARNQILAIIHNVNFAGGKPPQYIFKDKRDINSDTVIRVRETAKLIPISETWAYKELGVPTPKDGDKILLIADEDKGIATPAKADFSANNDVSPEFDILDKATSIEIEKIWQFAQNADSLDTLKQNIESAFPGMSQGALVDVMQASFELEFMKEMSDDDNT
jgi:phage gp29-like protein